MLLSLQIVKVHQKRLRDRYLLKGGRTIKCSYRVFHQYEMTVSENNELLYKIRKIM